MIETGTGSCHIYVDETADLQMAADIVINAKTQRVGVCNACESLLVNRKVKDAFLPVLAERLKEKHVEVRADKDAGALMPESVPATEEDWGTEYLDYILSVKVVDSVEEAIAHINKYNTKHSEAIITNDYSHAQKFLDEVDAAAVYVNASTRFTDGNEFGFGAEIGISTQKTSCTRTNGTSCTDDNQNISFTETDRSVRKRMPGKAECCIRFTFFFGRCAILFLIIELNRQINSNRRTYK